MQWRQQLRKLVAVSDARSLTVSPSLCAPTPWPPAAQGPKQRKAVDRRASKGRKLRYHVHPKLVSFMTPVELDAPQYAAQLFSNLFGGGGARK